MSKEELACVYAALILVDDNVPITAEKIQTILKAANVDFVEPIWPALFAKALQGADVKDLITKILVPPIVSDEKKEYENKENDPQGVEKDDWGDIGEDSDPERVECSICSEINVPEIV